MRKIDLTNFQIARSETARHINRRVMLNLIRQHQPVSRADLARHSGLQRSTVSIITEQLIKERWVTEGAIGHALRGRKPRFLHLNKERVGIFGVNIRPATTTFGLANLDAHFLMQESMPTLADSQQFINELGKRIRHVLQSHPEISYEGIGVSLPGRVNLATQQLVFAPNLGWGTVDLKKELESATGLPVELENAANACALAEIWFGHHSDQVQDLIAVTVSEGIGAGIMVNGQLLLGSNGAAGEFGHVTLIEDGLTCRCGNRGCWEMYASNSAAIRYYMQANSRPRNGKAHLADVETVPTFEDILRLAEHGAPKAIQALETMARHIGMGLAILVTGLAPDAIVVVGEITRAWQQVGPIIETEIKRRCFTHAKLRLHPTDPASQPRLRGTIALVLQKHFGAPSVA
ncbi:MAG: ROK family transcriptional regulator [Acidobacteria bacterium]|nr:ROK family transcriptional regulator [Acidobacteriota bacterium]MBI3422856.1 ROK family transcriptional regulator [Acidobacteriota bacterium]